MFLFTIITSIFNEYCLVIKEFDEDEYLSVWNLTRATIDMAALSYISFFFVITFVSAIPDRAIYPANTGSPQVVVLKQPGPVLVQQPGRQVIQQRPIVVNQQPGRQIIQQGPIRPIGQQGRPVVLVPQQGPKFVVVQKQPPLVVVPARKF